MVEVQVVIIMTVRLGLTGYFVFLTSSAVALRKVLGYLHNRGD